MQTNEKTQKTTKVQKFLSKVCCCHKNYEIEVIPISTTYFKRYDPRNISIRKSVRKSLKKFDSKQTTGMAKFVKPKAPSVPSKQESVSKLRTEEQKRKEDEEAERVVKSILDGKRPGTLKYKIDRSQSQPVLRVKNYFIYDL